MELTTGNRVEQGCAGFALHCVFCLMSIGKANGRVSKVLS